MSVSFGADLLQDENIDHAEKKGQNSVVERGRLHGEIEVLQWTLTYSALNQFGFRTFLNHLVWPPSPAS